MNLESRERPGRIRWQAGAAAPLFQMALPVCLKIADLSSQLYTQHRFGAVRSSARAPRGEKRANTVESHNVGRVWACTLHPMRARTRRRRTDDAVFRRHRAGTASRHCVCHRRTLGRRVWVWKSSMTTRPASPCRAGAPLVRATASGHRGPRDLRHLAGGWGPHRGGRLRWCATDDPGVGDPRVGVSRPAIYAGGERKARAHCTPSRA